MTGSRPRYRVRRAVAGSFLAAAAAVSLAGVVPASAREAPPVDVDASSEVISGDDADAAIRGTGAAAARLAGVRAELDDAVLFRLVTSEQADDFYGQIQRRVAAGL